MKYRRIVIKIGTSTITGGTKAIDQPALLELVRQINVLVEKGVSVVLVSSGAVTAGREALNFPHFPKHIPEKQMLAAIGQPRLMAVYNKIFRMYGINTAQILLTRNDFSERACYLNARNTLEALIAQNVIPIINENDTISINELKLGDNDTLSAMVAGMIGADLLLLITDQKGIYTANPATDPNAELIETVNTPEIPESIRMAAGGSISGVGTGGMATKVSAADIARRMGTTVMVAGGSVPNVLIRIAEGERVGTVFEPVCSIPESRKRYLLTEYRDNGSFIRIDKGAAAAILSGKSLLPAGVRSVNGSFERGDPVKIVDPDEHEVGIGLASYSSEDLTRIKGASSGRIAEILGYTFGNEAVHHDYMVLN